MSLPYRPHQLVQQTLYVLLVTRLPGLLLGLLIGFGFAISVQAAEAEACGFGLLQCDEQGVVWDFAAAGADNVAQLTSNDGIAEAIITFGYFLNYTIVPLIIGVALFIFLYYLARLFIIDTGSSDKREEGQRRAIWGIAAFVVIAGLWGIVNLFIVPQIDRERSMCPDYLGNWCGNRGYDLATGGYDGTFDLDYGGTSEYDVTTGGDDTTAYSALGELLFATYRDNASFNFRAGAPRAASSAVTISSSTSCMAGIEALQLAADVEQLQSSYVLARQNGNLVWHNVTDGTGETRITHDAEYILSNLQGADSLALIHTHPQATIDTLNLPMDGYAPSASDLGRMCDDVVNDAQFVVVDKTNVWVVESTGSTCPRRNSEEDDLEIISILLQLALLEPNARSNEFAALYNWPELPSTVNRDLRDYLDTDFASLSSNEIVLLADDVARDGGMRIERNTAVGFCAEI